MSEAQLLAAVIFHLRIVLGPFLRSDADPDLRVAAGLAYALHNPALAVMEGKSFDCEAALAGVERMIGGTEGSEVVRQIRLSVSGEGNA